MYLHLGGDVLLHEEEVIGIFDLDITSQSFRTRRFLNTAEQDGEVFYVDIEEIPKSFTVAVDSYGQRVYVSPLSPQTLQRRAESDSLY